MFLQVCGHHGYWVDGSDFEESIVLDTVFIQNSDTSKAVLNIIGTSYLKTDL